MPTLLSPGLQEAEPSLACRHWPLRTPGLFQLLLLFIRIRPPPSASQSPPVGTGCPGGPVRFGQWEKPVGAGGDKWVFTPPVSSLWTWGWPCPSTAGLGATHRPPWLADGSLLWPHITCLLPPPAQGTAHLVAHLST